MTMTSCLDSATVPTTSKLNRADRHLFHGTAAEVHSWMSNQEILRSIGCDFQVVRTAAEARGRTYSDCQLWLRDDNQAMLGFFGRRRHIIQPSTFLDHFRSFCAASDQAISLDVVGSYGDGKTLYMGAKLTDRTGNLLDDGASTPAASRDGMAISRRGSSRYIPSEDRTDHWLLLTESFGESLRPRVVVIANELICANGLARRVNTCELKLSHTCGLDASTVHGVLAHALRQCRAYDQTKERLIQTPINMETARAALRDFFSDDDDNSRIVRRLERIYAQELIGGDRNTRSANAWRLASTVTQYTSHERIGRKDVAFRSQLEGARARTANGFMAYLENHFLNQQPCSL